MIAQGGIHNRKDVAKLAVATITGAVGGGLGATGINIIGSAGIDAGLTFVNDVAINIIDNNFSIKNINWMNITCDTIESGLTSLVLGKAFDSATGEEMKKAEKAVNKGKNKIIKNITSKKTASKVKGSIKTGQKMIKNNRKIINRIRFFGSVLGSVVSVAKSIFKKILKV